MPSLLIGSLSPLEVVILHVVFLSPEKCVLCCTVPARKDMLSERCVPAPVGVPEDTFLDEILLS